MALVTFHVSNQYKSTDFTLLSIERSLVFRDRFEGAKLTQTSTSMSCTPSTVMMHKIYRRVRPLVFKEKCSLNDAYLGESAGSVVSPTLALCQAADALLPFFYSGHLFRCSVNWFFLV
jgi:hypothetical protein